MDSSTAKDAFRNGAITALPERWVTVHSGDMGYTSSLCEESKGALAGVQPYGRASQIRSAASGWREDGGGLPGVRDLAQDRLQAHQSLQ
ncbi:hypothetical protein MES5069_430004 [Mesorhizobium escarrei]|uniref:Uncharacterized protein n=1 Tax=Mesorhizobium escarrei TaxID=666018 RepID=A0ABN8K2T9_9HYPH|nr:hypothetical protein MES5069_430004 [Mesorhizobium escarrei]